ncbi:MAG: hypothetical protein ACD_39C01858G0003, partial [uncultured bacterium]
SELARAIRILLSHPEERSKIGANARKVASTSLSWQSSADALSAVYDQLLG